MKKQIFAILLVFSMMLALMAGCGTPTASESATESAGVEETTAPAELPEQTAEPSAEETQASASAEEASVLEETPAHRVNLPGSESAELDYINDLTLPITEEPAELTMLTPAVNLMGDQESMWRPQR